MITCHTLIGMNKGMKEGWENKDNLKMRVGFLQCNFVHFITHESQSYKINFMFKKNWLAK